MREGVQEGLGEVQGLREEVQEVRGEVEGVRDELREVKSEVGDARRELEDLLVQVQELTGAPAPKRRRIAGQVVRYAIIPLKLVTFSPQQVTNSS